jgi:hypothetical protein
VYTDKHVLKLLTLLGLDECAGYMRALHLDDHLQIDEDPA